MASSIDIGKLASAIAIALAEAMKPDTAGAQLNQVPTEGTDARGEVTSDSQGVVVDVEEGTDDAFVSSDEVAASDDEQAGFRHDHSPDEVCERADDNLPRRWSDVVSEGSIAGVVVDESGSGCAVQVAVPQAPKGIGKPVGGEAFYATYVRTANVQAMRVKLERACGHRLPRSAGLDVALVTYTGATVPSAFVRGRERLQALAAVGDAALSLAATTRLFHTGGTAAEMNTVKSKGLTNSALASKLAESMFSQHIAVAGDAGLDKAKVGGTSFEALAGVLSVYSGNDAVIQFMTMFGV